MKLIFSVKKTEKHMKSNNIKIPPLRGTKVAMKMYMY